MKRDAWTPYEREVGFRLNPFLWTDEERAAYVESRRYRWPPKMFSEERICHLSDAAGVIHWPKYQEPEPFKTKADVLAWLHKEFGR